MSKQQLKIFIMTLIIGAFLLLLGTTYAYFQVRSRNVILLSHSLKFNIFVADRGLYLINIIKSGEDLVYPLRQKCQRRDCERCGYISSQVHFPALLSVSCALQAVSVHMVWLQIKCANT